MAITGGDLVIMAINIVFVFIVSHVSVDPEFPSEYKIGAYSVIGVISFLYLLFGVLL
jgi:hypothetical protein